MYVSEFTTDQRDTISGILNLDSYSQYSGTTNFFSVYIQVPFFHGTFVIKD